MDPNAAVEELNAEFQKGLEPRDSDRIAELVQALRDWMSGGGFAPTSKIGQRAWQWGRVALTPLYPWFRQLADSDALMLARLAQ